MKFHFYLKIIIIIAIIAINNIAYATNKPIKITTGIIPIQSLVAMVSENINNNINVVFSKSSISPHDYSLNVKEMQSIKSADIMFLISKNFEQEIIPNINTNKTKVIYLDELLKNYLVNSNLTSFKNSNHINPTVDYHFWLDTNIAKAILKITAEKLSQIDPNNAKKYKNNAIKYSKKIEELEKITKHNLSSVKRNFLVYHNAWTYFIKNNNLNKYYKGSIIAQENGHSHIDTNLGAKDVITLEKYVKNNNIVCILSEPQFDDAVVGDFINKYNLKTAVLDPIGKKSNNLVDNYFLMMKENTQQLLSCVK